MSRHDSAAMKVGIPGLGPEGSLALIHSKAVVSVMQGEALRVTVGRRVTRTQTNSFPGRPYVLTCRGTRDELMRAPCFMWCWSVHLGCVA